MQGWSAEGNLLTGYGGGYQYGPVTTAAPQQPQQQRNTGDELVAELMQATQGVSVHPSMWQLALDTFCRNYSLADLRDWVFSKATSFHSKCARQPACIWLLQDNTSQMRLEVLHLFQLPRVVCIIIAAHSICAGVC